MTVQVICGDASASLKLMLDQSVNCCVTSPPYYGLRDYGVNGQIGLEKTPEEYIERIVEVFREVRRVLKDDGTLWVNLGDSYAGSGKGGNPEESIWSGFVGNRQREQAITNAAGNARVPSGLKEGQPKWKSQFDIVRSKRDARRWGGGNIPASGLLKPKDLMGIPWRVAFALQADGWWLRSDIIWAKPNPMPESVTDRPTKAHEYIFLLSKSAQYYYDAEAIAEPCRQSSIERFSQDIENQEGSFRANGGAKTNGTMKAVRFGGNKADGYGKRTYSGKEWNPKMAGGDIGIENRKHALYPIANKRTIWTVSTHPYKEAHFATFPPKLIEPCILAGCPIGGTVLDPFNGAGTTGTVCIKHRRNYIGIELNPEYVALSEKRFSKTQIGMGI